GATTTCASTPTFEPSTSTTSQALCAITTQFTSTKSSSSSVIPNLADTPAAPITAISVQYLVSAATAIGPTQASSSSRTVPPSATTWTGRDPNRLATGSEPVMTC